MLKRPAVTLLLAVSFVAMLVAPACAMHHHVKRHDRDHDRLPDRWERHYGFSTRVPSARKDPDHDGLTNRSEYRHHTNPRRKDTDRDHLSDGAEIRRYHTNPRRRDTDHDGFSDGAEVAAGTNPRKRSSHPARSGGTQGSTPGTGSGSTPSSPPPSGGGSTPSGPPARTVTCSTTVSSAPAVQDAVRTAADGTVICVAGGSYPALSLDAGRTGDVTVAGAPGQHVTFADIGFGSGASHIQVQDVTSAADVQLANGAHDIGIAYGDFPSITLKPGVHDVSLQHNYLHGGDFGVLLSSSDCTVPGAPSWSGCQPDAPISNVLINGNKFQGPFGEDAMQIKNFRNVTVTNNEITEVREDGSHNDCLQTTFGGSGLVFKGNFEHDNRCQGLFIKDGAVSNVDVEDNYFVKNDRPCLNKTCQDGAPSTIWLGGVSGLIFRDNVLWNNQGGVWFNPDISGLQLDHDVIDTMNVSVPEDYDLIGEGKSSGAHSILPAKPAFVDAPSFDYRLTTSVTKGGATYTPGVDWRPADKHFGP